MSQRRNLQRRTKNPAIRPLKVLVVDDDGVIRNMMVDILDCEGYQPELASNGKEALQILRNQESYLVFLDMMMPVFNGKEVCAILAKHPELRQRHIIVLMSALDNIDETYNLDVDIV